MEILEKVIQLLKNLKTLCVRVSGYYFTERYPMAEYLGLSNEDVENDVEEAQKLIEILK
jgi:HEPN domain-containing protein